jgi:hypothetical protein
MGDKSPARKATQHITTTQGTLEFKDITGICNTSQGWTHGTSLVNIERGEGRPKACSPEGRRRGARAQT